MKKILYVLMGIVLFLATLNGCNSSSTERENVAKFDLSSFATDKGIYYLDNQAYLKFFDYRSGRNAYLCSKPECAHDTEDCYANSNASFIFVQDDKLYTIDGENNLVKRNLDGSNASAIMSLCNQYNSSNDSMAYPMSGLAIGDKLYITYDVKILDAEKGEENKKTILTCIDLNSKSEKILLEDSNSQYSINNGIDSSLYFFEYQSTSEDGGLSDLNKVNCILYKMNLKDNSVSVIYQDIQTEFNPCGYTNGEIYFFKHNPTNLYYLTFENPTPVKAEYQVLYTDDRGNIVYDRTRNNYMMIIDGKEDTLLFPENITVAFSYATDNGFVFSCTSGVLEGVNESITEQEKFYVSKEDFYSCKNQYYKIC